MRPSAWHDSDLSSAERRLLEAFQSGETAIVSETRPIERTEANWIRADFLRFLALGGDADRRPHAHGLQLRGAWIKGGLDLRGADVAFDFECRDCHFADDSPLQLRDARFQRNLRLNGCLVHGIEGDRLQVAGNAEFQSGDDAKTDRFESTAAIALSGSQILGDLSFAGALLRGGKGDALSFHNARIQGNVFLRSWDMKGETPATHRFEAEGRVRFLGAHIGGQLNCVGARFQNSSGDALDFDTAEIDGSVFLQSQNKNQGEHRFEAEGKVRFLGAHIGGQLSCIGARFRSSSGDALDFDTAEIDGSVFLQSQDKNQGEHRFEAEGKVRFLGAHIGGQLSCIGATFRNSSGDALDFGGAEIDGSVFLQSPDKNQGEHRFEAEGRVRFLGAHIGGQLNCVGARFRSSSGDALDFDRAEIDDSVFLQSQDKDQGKYRFEAEGRVRFLGAHIGGQLNCQGASLRNSSGDALSFERTEIDGDVFLRSQGKNQGEHLFEAIGTLGLDGITIHGDLDISGAKIDAPQVAQLRIRRALTLRDAVIHGRLRLGRDLTSEGSSTDGTLHCNGVIDARGIRIGRSLHIEEFTLNAGGASTRGTGEPIALDFEHARIEHGLVFQPKSAVGRVNLHNASCGSLEDDLSKWGDELRLDGFRYSIFAQVDSGDAKARIAWLDKQIARHLGDTRNRGREFRPQPWQQLQAAFRAAGNLDWARTVAIEFEDRLRRVGRIGTPPQDAEPVTKLACEAIIPFLHRCFGLLAGYGHRPVRLMLWFLGVWLGCALFYWFGAAVNAAFGPSDPLVFQHPDYSHGVGTALSPSHIGPPSALERVPIGGNWFTNPALPKEYSAFSPWIYSLDVFLPLIDLQQETDWAPLVPTPKPGVAELWHLSFGHLVRLVMWGETIFGWILSLLFVAIVSGLAKRREE